MFTLKNDPQCGRTAGGTGCALDCDRIDGRDIYTDPACLFDCVNYPKCVQQLFEHYRVEGRIGRNEKKENLYNGTEEIIIVLYEIFFLNFKSFTLNLNIKSFVVHD